VLVKIKAIIPVMVKSIERPWEMYHKHLTGLQCRVREVIRGGQIRSIQNIGSLFVDKDRLETFSKDRLLEELENYLVGAETS
jgi:hypothetical protein